MFTSKERQLLVECMVISLGAILALLWGLDQAMAWMLGGLILFGALTAQRQWSERKPERLGQSVLAKWVVIAVGFSAVFNGWSAVPLAPLIVGALAVNLANPVEALLVAMKRRRK